jgi:hypothetical protein
VANARISGSIGVVVLMAASDWPSCGELEDKRLIFGGGQTVATRYPGRGGAPVTERR